MASDAEVRAWARENGKTVSAKGAVSHALRAAYSAAQNGQPAPAADYPDGMTDDDFTAEAEPPDDLADDMAEATPRPVATPKATSRMTLPKLRSRSKPGSPSAKPKTKAKHPRVSTAELIGSAWRIAARIADPLPPMGRTLRLQSLIAGPALDDAVKGTMVDPFLQPLARLTRAGETVSALLAPNVAIGAMAWHLQQTEGNPNPVVMQACQEMLRHGLMAMMRVGGSAMAAQIAKERADQQQFGPDVEMLMAWILGEPADAATEEANMARAAATVAGQSWPQPEPEPAAV